MNSSEDKAYKALESRLKLKKSHKIVILGIPFTSDFIYNLFVKGKDKPRKPAKWFEEYPE